MQSYVNEFYKRKNNKLVFFGNKSANFPQAFNASIFLYYSPSFIFMETYYKIDKKALNYCLHLLFFDDFHRISPLLIVLTLYRSRIYPFYLVNDLQGHC